MKEDISSKLGQLFFVGFNGFTLSKETKSFIETIQPGGIIFFECNIKNKNQVKSLINKTNRCCKIKPFIAIDQEGGSVERLRSICTSVPSAWGLGKLSINELLAANKIIISELLELGFNMNLAPVLDINLNIQNPIIGNRSISNSPQTVSNYGLSIAKLFLKYKIIPVVKHFPGHGSLKTDSHLSLPILTKSKHDLNNFELIPFKNAIKNNLPAIMVGHINVPAIEKNKPASISQNILQGLLRKELGFKGLILTDELNMKGITKNHSLKDASYEAIVSGADLILFNWNNKLTIGAFNHLKERLQTDNEFSKRVEESYKRIVSIKQRLLSSKKSLLKTKNNFKLSLGITKKVVHWIRKDLFYYPLEKNKHIQVLYPVTPKIRKEDLQYIFKKLGIKKYALIPYNINPKEKDIKSAINKLKKPSRKVLISYYTAVNSYQKDLINAVIGKDPGLIVLSCGIEHDIEIAPKITNCIAAYAPNYISLLVAFKKILNRS